MASELRLRLDIHPWRFLARVFTPRVFILGRVMNIAVFISSKSVEGEHLQSWRPTRFSLVYWSTVDCFVLFLWSVDCFVVSVDWFQVLVD